MKSLRPAPMSSSLGTADKTGLLTFVKTWLDWFREIGDLLGNKYNNTMKPKHLVDGLTGTAIVETIESRFGDTQHVNITVVGTFSLSGASIVGSTQDPVAKDSWLSLFDAGVFVRYVKIASGSTTVQLGDLPEGPHDLSLFGGVILNG